MLPERKRERERERELNYKLKHETMTMSGSVILFPNQDNPSKRLIMIMGTPKHLIARGEN